MKVTIHEEMEKKILTHLDIEPGKAFRFAGDPPSAMYIKLKGSYWYEKGIYEPRNDARGMEVVPVPQPESAPLTFADVEVGQGMRFRDNGAVCVKRGHSAYQVLVNGIVNHSCEYGHPVEAIYDLELIARRVK